MSKRTVSGITLTLLLIGMITLAFKIQAVNATGTVYIRADGSIDPPSAPISSDDNVTYTLTDNIISDADGIIVERDNIVIDGAGYILQATLQSPSKSNGIYLDGRSNVTIMDIVIKYFYCGVWLNDSSKNTISGINVLINTIGIELNVSSENIISGNNVECCATGIELYDSLNNSLLGNNITGYRLITGYLGRGIRLIRSSNSTLRNNIIVNNRYSLDVSGYSLSQFIQDIDVSNTVDGKPVYYWVNKQDASIPVNAGYVGLVNCTRITVESLDLKNNYQSVLLAYTTNTNITENNIAHNYDEGIWLYGSHDNFVSGNNITNCGASLFLEGSYNNIISGNTFENNSIGTFFNKDSFNNSLLGNNITNNGEGIWLHSSNNIISGNSVSAIVRGIDFYSASNNTISENNVTDNNNGINLLNSSNNTISRNNIANNNYGILLSNSPGPSSNNTIYHNNIVNNTHQASADNTNTINTWDNGYPSGGNYWSDYNRTDLYSGPYQNETGSDGIGDTPYEVGANDRDNYPLIEPWTPIIKATVDSYPQTLKLTSTNRWITAYIELQKRYSVADINVSTIMLNGTIPAELDILPEIGDYDNDIIPDLKITFNRTALCEFILAKGIMTGNVTLTITGKLYDGTPFEPTTVIKVRMPGDVNIDGKVDGKDTAFVAKAFGSYPNHPRWNPVADENEDNKIEGQDIVLVAKNYGKTYI